MKKAGILHAALAHVIAGMGHTDLLVIADAGFPVPPGVPCVDLAVRCGLLPMLDVSRAIADELEVEALTVADELLARDDSLPIALRELFPGARFDHLSHEELKRISARAKAVVRTGECTPYHNVILAAGVTFQSTSGRQACETEAADDVRTIPALDIPRSPWRRCDPSRAALVQCADSGARGGRPSGAYP